MGQTIQLKDHAFNTPLYPITKAENVKLNDERDLVDEIESINGKIESIIQGESELEKYATTEYVDNNLANKADVGHIHQMQDIEGIEELEAQFDNMFEEYTQEQISVDFPNASTISIVDNDDLFTATTIEGALRELANNSGSGNAEGIKFDNSSNEMTSVNVQDAIEENKTSILNIENELSKSENTSYATENGIKEFSCKDGYVDNVVIEGETLVNIAPMVVVNGADADGVVRTRFSNLGDNYKFYPRTQKGTFTLMNHTDKGIWFVGMTSSNTWPVESFYVEPFSARVVTLDGSRCINGVDFQPAYGWSNSDLSIYKSSMYSILEGEYDYMPYFEGLKSVGQGDSIEVLSCNEDAQVLKNFTKGLIQDSSGNYLPNVDVDKFLSCLDYVPVSSSCEYFIDFDINKVYFYDSSKNYIGFETLNKERENIVGNNTFKTPNNCAFIRFRYNLENNTRFPKFATLCKKQDKKQISTTIRSLPNGIKDTIEKRGNKYYKIKRCGEVVLDGDFIEGKYTSGETVNTLRVYTPLAVGLNVKTNSVECNHFTSDKFKSELNLSQETTDVESLSIKVGGEGRFVFRLSKSKLPTQDLAGAKTWLKSNPVTVVYELATPIIEELPNFNPQTFEGDTTLLINSGVIQTEADFGVTNSLGSEIEVLKDKISDLDDNLLVLDNNIGALDTKIIKLQSRFASSLSSLGFTNDDFSQTDLAGNLEKIITRLGANARMNIYVYNGYMNNLNMSLKKYLGITVDGYGLDFMTTNNTACSNPIYIYPNNTTDLYILNLDSGLRKLGKVAFNNGTVFSLEEQIELLQEENKNLKIEQEQTTMKQLTLEEKVQLQEDKINILTEENKKQDEVIDVALLATDEIFMMLEPLLVSQVSTLNTNVNKITEMYVLMVQRGLKTIDEVPASYREAVRIIIEK